jgi:hypothetical protein
MLSKEYLEKKKIELEKQIENLKATLNANLGALELLHLLLKECEENNQ